MQVPNILNLIATAVLLRVACAGRDAVPNTNAKVTERQQVQEQIVGPESFDIREGVRFNVTAVFSLRGSWLASKADASYLLVATDTL